MSFIEGLLYPWIVGPQLHMLVIMRALLSGYNIGLSTIHEAHNVKVLCLFANASSSGPFLYNIVQYAFPPRSQYIDHGGRRTRPRRVGARYGHLVAQRIANGLLSSWSHLTHPISWPIRYAAVIVLWTTRIGKCFALKFPGWIMFLQWTRRVC